MTKSSSDNPKLSIRQILFSTLAAAFGVQSGKNLKRDFAAGSPAHFIVAGIVFTVVFVLTIVAIVNWIL